MKLKRQLNIFQKKQSFKWAGGAHGVTCKAEKKEIMIPPGLSKNGQQYLTPNIPPRSAPVHLYIYIYTRPGPCAKMEPALTVIPSFLPSFLGHFMPPVFVPIGRPKILPPSR